MRSAILAVAALACGSAEAATYIYSYESRPIRCPYDECWGWDVGQVYYLDGFLAIDEDLLPVGSLAGASLGFELYSYDRVNGVQSHGGPTFLHDFSLRSPDGSLSTSSWISWPRFISFGGEYMSQFIGGNVWESFFSITFDADKNVSSWSGHSWQGGSNDLWSDTSKDWFWSGFESDGPGTWTRTVVPDDPSPVALPPAWLAMAGGIAGLGFFSRARGRLPKGC